MNREVDMEQVLETDDLRIERDLHDLGVACGPGADVLVRRVGHPTTGISRLDVLDTLQVLESRFEAPEAAAGEGRDFALRHPNTSLEVQLEN